MFFQELFNLSESLEVSLLVVRKHDKLTISFLPARKRGISPVIITGTPVQLDEGFIQAITAPVETATGLKIDTEIFDASVSEVSEVKAKPKKEAAGKKEKPAPIIKEQVQEVEEQKATEPTLFDVQ